MNLDGVYFEWLYSHIGALSNPNPARGYFLLAEQAHQKDFAWSVLMDVNRAEDGVALREEFLKECHASSGDWFARARDVDSWLREPCSMLEMMIALARRMAFETYIDGERNLSGDWFRMFLRNMGIAQFTDDQYNEEVSSMINNALEVVINRTYSENGEGGLFVLENPQEDLRNVELWYQMSEFVVEYFGD